MAKAESNTYPKIQRLQEVILYPCNISDTKRDEQGGVIYTYDEYIIPDVGQQIADRETFVKENWIALQAAAMNDRTASPKVEGMWEDYKSAIETKFNPAPTVEAIAEIPPPEEKPPADEKEITK
jgi:hypothetical protein